MPKIRENFVPITVKEVLSNFVKKKCLFPHGLTQSIYNRNAKAMMPTMPAKLAAYVPES